MRVLDLFSGLGGFSEAFVQAGDEVARVENNPLLSEVPFTTMQDVHAMRDRLEQYEYEGLPIREYDVLLAGVPCDAFSLGFHAPQAVASRSGEYETYEPDMSNLECALAIIRITKPRYWVIENVIGSIRHFEKYGLSPRIIVGSHVLYGNFPLFEKIQIPTKAERDTGPSDPLRKNKRGQIPLALSIAIRNAILEQTTLFDFA